jgi:ribosomal protein S18 acetylase RimI-like enzyme
MTPATFDAFTGHAIPEFAADKVASGQWSEAEALALAHQSFDELLPQGMNTPGHHFFTIVEGASAEEAGAMWIAVQAHAGRPIAYVYDIQVHAPYRRRGVATRAFAALEAWAQSQGLTGIALHVFGHNAAARALYDALGFQATNVNMFKPIR